MTRAKDISKILTDADLSGTLDVTGTVTAEDVAISSSVPILRFTDTDTNETATVQTSNSGHILLDASQGNASGSGGLYVRTQAQTLRALFGSNGDISFYEDTGTTPKLFWDASAESLGIGTSSPDTTTQISKSTTSTDGSVYPTLKVENTSAGSGNSYARFQVNGGNGTTGFTLLADGRSSNSDVSLRTTTNTPMSFYTNNSERMRIDSSGNVGIGTSSPNRMLTLENGDIQIHDSGTGDPLLNFSVGGTQASPTQSWTFRIDNSDSDKFQLMDVTDSRIVLTADGSGNVGIGTDSPSATLDVNGDVIIQKTTGDVSLTIQANENSGAREPQLNLKGYNTGSNPIINFGDNVGYAGFIEYENSDNSMRIGTNTAERLRITSAGNVGIGTTSPSQALTINDGSITSNVTHTFNLFGATGTGGSANYVTYSFVGDPNTGMFSGTADTLKFATGGSERMRIITTGFTKHSDNGTYRGVSGNYHEVTTSTSGGGFVSAFQNASYADGGIQSIVTRASAGTTYRFFEGYSNNAADREFRVDSDGTVRADGAYSSAGGDYAEMFEWKDGNSSSEDRVGKTVVLDGNQIKLSTSDDAQATIIGVVSARPVILGDAHDEKWIGKYETDSYGRYVFEEYTQTEWTEEDEDGNKSLKSYQTDLIPSDVTVPSDAIVTSTEIDGETPLTRRKLNSSYDATQTYTPRVERKEFSAIGLVGKLRVTVGQTVGDRWIKMREISDTVHEYLVR